VEQWIKDLPHARVAYPTAKRDRLKYWFWRFYTPLHPLVRGTSYRLGFGKLLMGYVGPEVRYDGRQDYLIGTLRSDREAHDLVDYLVTQGYGNHFIAWKDTGELVSLRRADGFEHQYHLRIFKDGEVRGHYELTPEYRPVRHLVRTGFEDRTGEFTTLLTGWLA